MSAREDFGEPFGSEVLLVIGELYFRRGLLQAAIRALLSGIPPDVAADTLMALLIEHRDDS